MKYFLVVSLYLLALVPFVALAQTAPPPLPELTLPTPGADLPPLPPLPGAAPSPTKTETSVTTTTTTSTPVVTPTPVLPPAPPVVEPAAAPTSVPALPPLGELPDANKPLTSTTTTTVETKVETPVVVETPAPVKVAKTKGKKKKSKKKKKHAKVTTKIVTTTFRKNYKTQYLPEAVYSKTYDRRNLHLPVAYDSRDYDALMFLTIARDDVNGLRAMLTTGRALEMRDRAGDTPLLSAVKHNSINSARLLLARHADIRTTDANGRTALDIAQATGNYPMLRALEEMGAHQAQLALPPHPLM